MLTCYFALGAHLSFKHIQYGKRVGEFMSLEERALWVILEIELPMTLFIMFTFWGFIVPAARADGNDDAGMSAWSFFSHGFNVVFFLLEFVLNDLYIHARHFSFVICWNALYILFHTILMLGREAGGFDNCPVYFFLDAADSLLAMYCILFAIAIFIFYAAGLGLSSLKSRAINKHAGIV